MNGAHSTTRRGTRSRRSVTEKAAIPSANQRKTRSCEVGRPTVKIIAPDAMRYAAGAQNRSPLRGLTRASSHAGCFASAASGHLRVDDRCRRPRNRARAHRAARSGRPTRGRLDPLPDPRDRGDPDRRASGRGRPRGHAEGLSTLGGVSPLLRRRRAADGIAADGLKARRPHAGLLRRERRALLKARADALGELGGLLVEMYRRGGFRDDLLAERAAAIVGIDGRAAEIEALLHTG